MRIRISLVDQCLELHDSRGNLVKRYAVSTARKGAGERRNSYQTPRGQHVIRAKIGAGAAPNSVFVRRRPTGEIWSPELAECFPGRDWILTRIMWLSGREPGRNRLGEVDTMRRYIYLHGSPDTVTMGVPGSIGCVRMRNADIVDLFDRVDPGIVVDIGEFGLEIGGWDQSGPLARPIRDSVFIQEQGVPRELEWDEMDALSRHVLARDGRGRVIGTARLLPDGHIGRVAVASEWRGERVGRAMMLALIEEAGRLGQEVLALNSQAHAVGFYSQFGFMPEGGPHVEAGIPHQHMVRLP